MGGKIGKKWLESTTEKMEEDVIKATVMVRRKMRKTSLLQREWWQKVRSVAKNPRSLLVAQKTEKEGKILQWVEKSPAKLNQNWQPSKYSSWWKLPVERALNLQKSLSSFWK